MTDGGGGVLLGRGDVHTPVFPRSSMKPVQALAMVRAGLDLPDELLALVCASHSGESYHLQGVRTILARAGIGEGDLQNTPALPLDETERQRWIRKGWGPTSLAQNCSGKHAGMLATCVVAGWDHATYRDIRHPLQRAIVDTLEESAGEPVAAVAVDGCGAPVMAISLAGLARAFGTIAAADPETAQGRIAHAMRTAPAYVGGTGRDVTALMEGTPGLIAKDGAEAVYAVGLADGRGIAVKIADGGDRARPVVLAAVLRHLGVISSAYEVLERAPVLGHGDVVGAVVAHGL